jgi:hypothetical protein
MQRVFSVSAAILLLALVASGWATDPLVGTWQLDHQEFDGHKKETEAMTLRISPEGDKFLFAFSVPVNNIDFVSMTYSAKLDGSEAEVKDARGNKVGTVRITSPEPLHYRLLLKGENRPETTANLSVSKDGNTLTSDSASGDGGHSAHLVQSFVRR